MADYDIITGRNVGLVRRGHALCYVARTGRLRWAPWWLRRSVVGAWNWTACRLFGHDVLDVPAQDGFRRLGPRCVDCGKTWRET